MWDRVYKKTSIGQQVIIILKEINAGLVHVIIMIYNLIIQRVVNNLGVSIKL